MGQRTVNTSYEANRTVVSSRVRGRRRDEWRGSNGNISYNKVSKGTSIVILIIQKADSEEIRYFGYVTGLEVSSVHIQCRKVPSRAITDSICRRLGYEYLPRNPPSRSRNRIDLVRHREMLESSLGNQGKRACQGIAGRIDPSGTDIANCPRN